MGPFKFAWKMLKLEYKKTFFYALTLVVTVAVVFVFFNYCMNPYLGNNAYVSVKRTNPNSSAVSFTTALSMIMICISVLAACFSNSVYLAKKTNEIAVQEISGGTIGEIASYLIGQNFIVGLIAIPIGLIIGNLLNPLMNLYMYTNLGIKGSLFYTAPDTWPLTIVYIFGELVAITIINTGFVYRNDILTLLNMDKSIQQLKPASNLQIPVIVYWVLFFVPFYFFTQKLNSPKDYAIYSLIGIYGIRGLYARGLPRLLEKIQSKFNLCKAKELIAVGNVKYTISKTKDLVIIIIFSIVGLLGYTINYVGSPTDFTIMFISYITVIILMTLMILYKVMLENDSHAHIYKSLYKLGYTNKDIYSIIKKEVTYYYGLILFFISCYAVPIIIIFLANGTIKLYFGIELFLLYFLFILGSAFVAYFNYRGEVFKKEAK